MSPKACEDGKARSKRSAANLNPREHQVLSGLRDGATDREIAERLGVSDRTVSFYVRSLSAKLDAKNRTHTVVKALKLGLIKLE